MAETAPQIQYRQEFISGFEQRQSLFRESVTTESVIKGNQATFLVADSGNAEAVTRGVNGLIPSRADNLAQPVATLSEWHDLVRKTGFNIFQSQGDQRAVMQQTTMGVMNRKIDQDIITELNTGTVDTGTAQTASMQLATRATVILGNNEVPFDGNVWCAMTPAMRGYLLQLPEFSSADYVSVKPVDSGSGAWKDQVGFYRWMDVNWFVHPRLPGVGTNAEKCFMYHSTAIGHAVDMSGMSHPIGYEEEQDYSYARCTLFMGSKLLQNSGVVVINHDGSGFAAE